MSTAEGLLLCVVGGLVLGEVVRGGEGLVTFVAKEDCISLENDETKTRRKIIQCFRRFYKKRGVNSFLI